MGLTEELKGATSEYSPGPVAAQAREGQSTFRQ
jgi:hypothetical protein